MTISELRTQSAAMGIRADWLSIIAGGLMVAGVICGIDAIVGFIL